MSQELIEQKALILSHRSLNRLGQLRLFFPQFAKGHPR
jgi:hypothetical protein